MKRILLITQKIGFDFKNVFSDILETDFTGNVTSRYICAKVFC